MDAGIALGAEGVPEAAKGVYKSFDKSGPLAFSLLLNGRYGWLAH